jgi:hypothetical protein
MDADGRPIARATVEWGSDREPFERRQRVETDEAGKYTMAVKAHENTWHLAASADRHSAQLADSLILKGKHERNFILKPVPQDSGFITGTVVDVQGKPIEGVRVEAFTRSDATNIDALRQLGAQEFSSAVVGVGTSIESSVLITVNLVDLGIEHLWVKAITPSHGKILTRIGANHVIYPEADELTALRQLTDCLVSAHRAEGFGLNIAEAMAIGKPVVATKYSGNLQFCNDKNSLLVSATLCEVEDGIRHYPAGVIWADPDHNELVAAMRRVVADPAFARSVGRQAAEDIGHGFGRERISTLIGQALEEIQSCVEPISQSSQRRSRLAWLHPGVLGSAEFTQGAWPTFSLIILVHNTASSALAECIESMMAQTYPYWELCISDDASSDPQTIEYLEALRRFDQRISIRRLSERRGLPDAINAAVEITTGEFLMFIDPTGAIEPDRLATLAASVVANPHRALLSYNQDGSEADKPRILTVRKRLFLRSGGCGLENENADQDLMSRIVHATGPLS